MGPGPSFLDGDFVWNGAELGLLWRDGPPEGPLFNSELYFQRFDENLNPLGPVNRLTFSDGTSDEASLVWADGEWGVAWREEFIDGYREVAFMRLDATGAPIDPPGVVQLTFGAELPGGTDKGLTDIQWSGQEYAVFYHDTTAPVAGTGDVLMARVTAAGVHLPPNALLTLDGAKKALFLSGVWNGEDYAVAWQDSASGTAEVVFGKMGCRCTDSDGDLFTTCLGGDCDDGSGAVNPLALEICGNGADDNCDGLTDCMDAATCPSSGPVPGEVSTLGFEADKQTLSWQAVQDADAYDVGRGLLSDLRFERDARYTECFDADLTAPGTTDPETPVPGEGRYYLVRTEAGNPANCRLGTWGQPQDRDGVIAACP